jgi:hypothetical protein
VQTEHGQSLAQLGLPVPQEAAAVDDDEKAETSEVSSALLF